MSKQLVTIEFRYDKKQTYEDDYTYRNKVMTIGIFDELKTAIEQGNRALNKLSNTFEVRQDDKFSLNGGCFGSSKRLVTNCCYPTKGIQYFAKITELKFEFLNDTINDIFKDKGITNE